MAYIKWTFIIAFWTLFGAFLHYTLPQTDIVRVVNTYEERQELGDWTRMFWSVPDDQSAGLINRDVQFIQTVRANGRPMVYRNEDTGWGWPPYFKFDTANLYTEAADATSTAAAPRWYALRHYGWRNEFLSIFPNAVSLRPVEGPDVRIIPWLNIVILTLLAATFYAIWVRWRRFRMARIDPVLEDIEEGFDAAGDAVAERRGRIRRWLGTWRGR
ncbi:MAG: DUF1523 family protein [Rhodobacteraceae bacterium]|nr:MAG: DUF1523 family protein [Paracoccaceae bacterium]